MSNDYCLLSHQDDEKFLTDLFAQLTDEATDDEKRHELVKQLHQKCPDLQDAAVWLQFYIAVPLILQCSLLGGGKVLLVLIFFCFAGKFPKGILCIFTNTATSKQRCLLQNLVKYGHPTSTRSYIGKPEWFPPWVWSRCPGITGSAFAQCSEWSSLWMKYHIV